MRVRCSLPDINSCCNHLYARPTVALEYISRESSLFHASPVSLTILSNRFFTGGPKAVLATGRQAGISQAN